MSTIDATLLQRRWTASEIRKLPPQHRDAILREAAANAEAEYQSNPEMTDFDAFGPEDLHGDSANAESR